MGKRDNRGGGGEGCQWAVVSKLILLGVPNSIKEDVIKDTLDEVLSELECTLLQTDSKYKLTKDQKANWINYAVNREFPLGMPWEDAEEKKKKQGGNNMYCMSINPATIESANYAIWQNNASCGVGQPLGKHGLYS